MTDRDDWILDVLEDLKTFAEANDLPFLAESLGDARRLAMVDLSLRAENRCMRPAERAGGAARPGPDQVEN